MTEQNYKNHRQIVFTYHILTGLAIIALLIGAIRNAIYSDRDNFYSATLIILVALIFISFYIYARAFALKAQDRAIRAEENLRYYVLTGKLLPDRLTTKQIVALRFASDEELPELIDHAMAENLSGDAIKKQIKNWRPDYYRA
jgi:hypothetical protein